MELRFFRCSHCGNIITKIHDSGVPVVCCGEPMQELIANIVDASQDKHIPAATRKGNIITVLVGNILHPMEEKHFIEWIFIQTKLGNQFKLLNPAIEPKEEFAIIDGDEVENVYAYCNIHGLWKF